MIWLIIALVSCIRTASAAFTGNLNYQSPSKHHASLGVSISKVAKRTYANSPWEPSQLNFTHGIASGDPFDDSVILWTRAAPSSDNDKSNVTVSGYVPLYDHSTDQYIASSNAPVCVDWKISDSDSLNNIADSGTAFTSSDIDYTIKVEARKLSPFTTYFYQFNICNSNNTSPVGRTKTIPSRNAQVSDPVKLAIYSCSNYPFGFFNAYGNPVRKDSVDYVVHLGDYIYEYANGEYGWGDAYGRIPLPDRNIATLYDYRKRIATYRTDLDLLASHQSFPWIPVWDDHEVSDNSWRDGNSHMNNTEESFIMDGGVSVDQLKMNAVRAYFEWMPIRQVDMDDNLRIWRSFQFGDLFDLIMLDTRQYDRAITDVYWNTEYLAEIHNDASRTLMGPRQEAWFYRSLRDSASRGATWRVVGNQIVFSRINNSALTGDHEAPYNYDQWDGYQANRNRTFRALYEGSIGNNVFLAGDSHASWVSDLVWLDEHPYDPATGAGSMGVEFAGSAVSSPSPLGQNVTLGAAMSASARLTAANAELQWQDFYYRGYYELSVTHEKVEAAFFGIPTNAVRQGHEIPLANFTVVAGENKLRRSGGGSAADGDVESGSLKGGRVVQTNLTHDTSSGEWIIYNAP
ncbi:PhoD-like phosphatase-domain-containing protein [Biscogniauxia mediterranea]|nr:PhoD-like phosphatase-domain-containing protein [Biscogniauxia mediterranea]